MTYIVRSAGDDPARAVKSVFDLGSGRYSGDFMAFSPSTDDATVDRLRKGLDRIKADGRFVALMKKWLN
jgi:polar amino acid transport system substrate-binding protein